MVEFNVPQIVATIQPNVLLNENTETGVFEPTEDIARPTIPFVRQHNKAPYLIVLVDSTGTDVPQNAPSRFEYFDFYMLFGTVCQSAKLAAYASATYEYRLNSSTATIGETLCTHSSEDSEDSSMAFPRNWAQETHFRPSGGSALRPFIAGRKYSWKAFWN